MCVWVFVLFSPVDAEQVISVEMRSFRSVLVCDALHTYTRLTLASAFLGQLLIKQQLFVVGWPDLN